MVESVDVHEKSSSKKSKTVESEKESEVELVNVAATGHDV